MPNKGKGGKGKGKGKGKAGDGKGKGLGALDHGGDWWQQDESGYGAGYGMPAFGGWMGGLTNAGTPTVNAKEAVNERPVDVPEPSPEWIRPRRVKGIRMCVLPECTSAACTTCVEHETPVQEPALEWKTPAKSGKIKFSKSSEFNESIHAAKSYANSFAALGEPEKESPDVASESQLIASACKYTKPNNSSSVSNLM